MTPYETREFEAIQVAIKTVARLRDRLDSCGLSALEPQLEIVDPDPLQYTSEIRVYLTDARGIADAIEFFVWNRSVEQASLAETQHYLEVTLADACARARTRKGAGNPP